MVFLAPLLSGIVVGLTAMIAFILNKLQGIITSIAEGQENVASFGGFGVDNILDMFPIVDMVPPYFMQIAIGIYIIQVIFILTSVLVTISSGDDKLKKTADTGKNLFRGVTIYFIVAFVASLVLSVLAGIALSGI